MRSVLHSLPRLPLEGYIDLTYRCNSRCRHCSVWITPDSPKEADELSLDEIRRIVDEARALGCQKWKLSGGEPMLRDDFAEIFDHVTRKAVTYTLNTNGTLITPTIAQLMRRRGTKNVALYGATAEVYDDVSRSPGSFEAAMRGFAYLREAGASFVVQLMPLRSNWHQWEEMKELAGRLSPQQRIGRAWLHMSSLGSPGRNLEIERQRLSPAEVIEVEAPDPSYQERMGAGCGVVDEGDDRLFARCIEGRRDFHVDPYGQMTWCPLISDPALRYDLRHGTFREGWEEFIPGCADKVRGGEEYRDGCGTCESRASCRWCAVFAKMETGRYAAPIPYLCEVAGEAESFKADWQVRHRRYFKVAGITVRIESDLDLHRTRFKEELTRFEVDGPGDDNVTLRHHFALPDLTAKDTGKELYRRPPWAISRKDGTWFYKGISVTPGDPALHRLAIFSTDHAHATIYSPPPDEERVTREGWHSLSLFPTDQIWLGPLLADRDAVLMHSAAAVVNGQGLVFIGHSSAGKSTTMELLKAAPDLGATILCDDRNVIRKWPEGWRVHGTWSHGTTADVSPDEAPLRAILFLQQDKRNELVPFTNRTEIWKRMLATLIKPMVTAEWWHKELDVLERIVSETSFYTMHFDRTGAIVPELGRLCR